MFPRLKLRSSSTPSRPRRLSVTFGQRLSCVGAWLTGNGYGCCAHASNRIRGAACHQLHERPRRDSVGEAWDSAVAAVRRGLPDGNESVHVAGLDPGVAGDCEPRVHGGADDPAGSVELRPQERRGWTRSRSRRSGRTGTPGTVPSSGPRSPARSRGSRSCRWAPSAAPGRRSPNRACPERHLDLETSRLGVPNELVEVLEAVGRVERPPQWPAAPVRSRASERACARRWSGRRRRGRAPPADRRRSEARDRR